MWPFGWETADVTSVLDREMYTEAEAARLLGVPQGTLHYWLEGSERPGKSYRPVIRQAPRGVRAVTWGEFVEAGLLREYRRKQVPLVELRRFIDELRDLFGVPYPLADRRPYISGKQLVYDAQTAAGLGVDYYLMAVANDQLILTTPAQNFVDKVTWDGDVAALWRPDPESPVAINPSVRFGKPAINGISTEVIWEQNEVGEDVDDIAETYELTVADVRWALAYENSQRAA